MGNCQAIDNASLVIQHANGRVERLYSGISAAEIMKLNPGHYVALLLTTTLYSSRPPPPPPPPPSSSTSAGGGGGGKRNHPGGGSAAAAGQPLRVTRIKVLRPTDTLTVGHIYRLITTQEVMKGLMAKKNGKINNNNNINKFKPLDESAGNHEAKVAGSNHSDKTHHQMKKSDGGRRRTAAPAKPRGWHPSLNSISEASS